MIENMRKNTALMANEKTPSPRRNGARAPDVHLNLNVRGLKQSATLTINELSAQLQREGREIFRLGLGQSPFPIPELLVEDLRANAHQREFLPANGLETLREAVASYHQRTKGIDCTAKEVLVGPGSKELMFLLQLVYYGDLVVPTPTWVSYAPQAQIIGRQIRWLPTRAENNWRLTPDELDKLCREDPSRPRLVILNYPSNPTGDTYELNELKEIAKVARNYRVVLLADEVYGELHHRGQHVSIARFYPEGTIVSSGLSKWCGAGGWRLGTFTFPQSLHWLLDAMSVVASQTYTSTSAPIQYAAVRAFQSGPEMEEYQLQARRILRTLGRHIWRRLKSVGIAVPEPKAAFYLFLDFGPLRSRLEMRGITSSDQICERLLEETGIALLPGSAFSRPAEELTARIAYVDFDGARAMAAAQAIPPQQELDKVFLETYCGKVITAIEILCDWLKTKL